MMSGRLESLIWLGGRSASVGIRPDLAGRIFFGEHVVCDKFPVVMSLVTLHCRDMQTEISNLIESSGRITVVSHLRAEP